MGARQSSSTWVLFGITTLFGLGALGLVAYERFSDGTGSEPSTAPSDLHVLLPRLGGGTAMHTIYLNREGAMLVGGEDDSAHNVSSIVRNTAKGTAHLPAFQGTPQAWAAIAACIRQKFAPFDVSIVEERPVTGRYIMAVLGGTPDDLGPIADGHDATHHQHDVLGLAPFSGQLVADAVVLIFSRRMREGVGATCETAGMEIAHAYGLDHERNCRDLMSYLPPCGSRTFVNTAARCGELADRACEGGTDTQNSYAKLLAALGPAVSGTAAQVAR